MINREEIERLAAQVPTEALLELRKGIKLSNPKDISDEDQLQAVVRDELIRRGIESESLFEV